MKKIMIAVAFLLPTLMVNAQYRKVSTERDRDAERAEKAQERSERETKKGNKKIGKTYEITGRASFITQNKCVQPALAYSFGKDRNDNRFFNWHTFEMVLPAIYKYNTTYTDFNTQEVKPVTVKAKAVLGFSYRFNYAYYLVDNSNDANKVLPFVNLGVSSLIHFGTGSGYVTSPSMLNGYVNQSPLNEPGLTFGFNGGVGLLFRVNNRFGILTTGGYSLQTKRIDVENLGDVEPSPDNDYFYYKSHPYFTFGLRFRVAGNKE